MLKVCLPRKLGDNSLRAAECWNEDNLATVLIMTTECDVASVGGPGRAVFGPRIAVSLKALFSPTSLT